MPEPSPQAHFLDQESDEPVFHEGRVNVQQARVTRTHVRRHLL